MLAIEFPPPSTVSPVGPSTTPVLTQSSNAPGCNKPSVRVVIRQPRSHCDTGIVEALPEGGTAPYQYSWNGLTFTSDRIYALPSGSHYVQIRDANNNIGACFFEVKQGEKANLLYTKEDACSSLNRQGSLTLHRFENFARNTSLAFRLTRLFDADTSTYVNTIVAGQSLTTFTAPITISNLTQGTYLLEYNDGFCEQRATIQICNQCGSIVESEERTAVLDCPGINENCAGDTRINLCNDRSCNC